MLTSAKFFESFDKAGFLKSASWVPSGGGGPYAGVKVRFLTPDAAIVDGLVVTADFEIRYVTEQLPGLKEAETVTVDGTNYKVRTPPMKILDGSVSRAELKRA